MAFIILTFALVLQSGYSSHNLAWPWDIVSGYRRSWPLESCLPVDTLSVLTGLSNRLMTTLTSRLDGLPAWSRHGRKANHKHSQAGCNNFGEMMTNRFFRVVLMRPANLGATAGHFWGLSDLAEDGVDQPSELLHGLI